MEPKIESTLENMREDYDWNSDIGAFSYAEFAMDDVESVIASSDGCNEEEEWVAVFLLKDGKYAGLAAGCDYTGWD